MKIPLEHEPFAPVTLSRAQEEKLQWLGDTLLEETLVENDEFLYQQNRTLDKARWKQVISRENIAIYKRAGKGELGGSTPDVDLYDSNAEPGSRYWRLPLCVGVGTLVGTLDDLLYGQLATTMQETKIRTTYTKDDGLDTRVLATIVKPSESEPLRHVLVRWILLCQLVHKIGVSPRDVVQLESIGTRILPNGERIGYIVVQSIDLPGCEALTALGLVRATYSSCYVFRDSGNGSIEVYMRAFMDPGGKLRDGIAVFSACMALISIWRLMIAGQNKKLAYMARTNLAGKGRADMFTIARGDNAKTCPLCLKGLSSFRPGARCDLCLTKMCSRCVDKRKLTYAQTSGRLVRVATQICKTCITTAAKMNAGDVAASEQLADSGRTIRFYSRETSSSGGSQPRQSPNYSRWLNRDSSDTITSSSTAAGSRTHAYSDAASVVSMLDTDSTLPSPSFLSSSAQSIPVASVDAESELTVDSAQFDLWVRMNQLRVAAEETYMLTKQNSEAMAQP